MRKPVVILAMVLCAYALPLKAEDPFSWIVEIARQLHEMEKAWKAVSAGDYSGALKELEALGDDGYAKAQIVVGVLYSLAVPPKYDQAAVWFRRAARQDSPTAQWFMGRLYANGSGVPENPMLAHMWYSLAAAQGHKAALKDSDALAAVILPGQLAESQQLVREWTPKKER